ncbi:unnamed protein product [Effrenium voratum]|uniref:Uncharacterized protein n=1 Tax=Effrenium voratum TaxID=2562239 RepID=A0AA36JEX3_9DINO|nr:unnamed protein product [Effrenium voratum]
MLARQELQQELKTSSEALRRRAEKAREEVHREISMLRKDIEEQVRDELRKEMVSLGQECSVSIEAQVKQSLASNRLERCVEELLLEHLARERKAAVAARFVWEKNLLLVPY